MSYGRPEITYHDIKCEECGKYFQKLQNHVIRIHLMTVAEYKEKWGFYRNQPLESLRLKQLRRDYAFTNKSVRNLDYNNPEHHKNIKGWWIGKKMPEQGKIHLKKLNVGKVITEKTKIKIGAASREHWKDPEYRKKQIENAKKIKKDKFGKFISDQTKTADVNTSHRGEDHYGSVLTNEKVMEIRRLSGKRTQSNLAALFGVSQSLINQVLQHRIWKHI